MEEVALIRKFFLWILDIEIWVVLVLISCGLVWSQLLPVSLLGIFLFWIIRWLLYHKLVRRTLADLAIGLVSISALTSLWVSPQFKESLLQVARLFLGIGLFFAVVNWTKNEARLKFLLLFLVIGGAILALLSPWIVEWSDDILIIPLDLYHQFPNITGDIVNANVMAGVLVLFIPVLVSILSSARYVLDRSEVIVYSLGLMVITGALFLTQSRGAIIATLCALFFMVGIRWKWGKWVLTTVFVLVLVLFLLIDWQNFGELINSGTQLQNSGGRLEVWSRAVYMLEDFGITGVGMGSFGYVADAIYPFDTFLSGNMQHAHNLFLQIGVDLGLPGLVGWLATLILVLLANWIVFSEHGNSSRKWGSALGAGLLFSQIAMIGHGLIDCVHWGVVRSAILAWLFWGMSFALFNLHINEIKKTA